MVSVKIGHITLNDIEETNHGLEKIGKKDRIYLKRTWMDNLKAISSYSFKMLVAIAYNLNKCGHPVGEISKNVLVEYITKYLKCSKKTAYNYANTLMMIEASV